MHGKLYWRPTFDFAQLKTGFFFILADLAEGGGGDFTVFHIFQLIGRDIFEEVGYWYSNVTSLELASVDFWIMYAYYFNSDRCRISIEWNTYGALFYRILNSLNEPEEFPEYNYRFNYAAEGIELENIVYYNKNMMEGQVEVKIEKKALPGIKITPANKIEGCSMVRMYLNNGSLIVYDVRTISEIENFEDKNGKGSYQAVWGHDDIVMTLVQIPLLMQTAAYAEIIEEFLASQISGQYNQEQQYNPYGDMYGGEMYGTDMYGISQFPPQDISYGGYY